MLQFDSDGSGSLDFPEFLSLIAKIQKGQAHHIFHDSWIYEFFSHFFVVVVSLEGRSLFLRLRWKMPI